MPKLFVLGTGFSKAVSDRMPTMEDLDLYIRNRMQELPGDHRVYERLVSSPMNIEELLTYLYQEMPWKTTAQAHSDQAAFLTISELIVEYITECEKEVYLNEEEIPVWVKDFASYLHKEKATVASFNYDTILEGLSMYIRPCHDTSITMGISNFYNMPIKHVVNRGESDSAFQTNPGRYETYRLIKLHGSNNWHFQGSENTPDQQIYYSDELMRSIHRTENSGEINRNKAGLIPLIIPPITEKTTFYGIRLIKSLWMDFYGVAEESDEVYFIGYSLPKTDLTTRIFLATAMNSINKKIYIVNLRRGSEELIRNYREVLQKCEIREEYISDSSPVESMAMDLIEA
jgi:hypothetical protein